MLEHSFGNIVGHEMIAAGNCSNSNRMRAIGKDSAVPSHSAGPGRRLAPQWVADVQKTWFSVGRPRQAAPAAARE
jgi:hypothetical protein